jgi:hypothetical protein
MAVPDKFTLAIEPFYGMPPKAMECRFRWRINKPNLTLGFKILRLERIIFDSIRAAGDIIAEETGVPVLY